MGGVGTQSLKLDTALRTAPITSASSAAPSTRYSRTAPVRDSIRITAVSALSVDLVLVIPVNQQARPSSVHTKVRSSSVGVTTPFSPHTEFHQPSPYFPYQRIRLYASASGMMRSTHAGRSSTPYSLISPVSGLTMSAPTGSSPP